MRGVNSSTSASQMMKPMPMIVQPTCRLSRFDERNRERVEQVGGAYGDPIVIALNGHTSIRHDVVVRARRRRGQRQDRVAPDTLAERRPVDIRNEPCEQPWSNNDCLASGVA